MSNIQGTILKNENITVIIFELPIEYSILEYHLDTISEELFIQLLKDEILNYEDFLIIAYIKHYSFSIKTYIFGEPSHQTINNLKDDNIMNKFISNSIDNCYNNLIKYNIDHSSYLFKHTNMDLKHMNKYFIFNT
jgi:hypothetical protein